MRRGQGSRLKAYVSKVFADVPSAGLLTDDTVINSTEKNRQFEIGVPRDAAYRGKISSTLRGSAPCGGVFGKDPNKVDRSAAYARAISPITSVAGACRRCTIQIAYAIGVRHR